MAENKKKSVPQRVIGFFKDGAEWVTDVVRDEEVRNAIRADIGLDPEDGTANPNLDGVDDRLANIKAYQDTIKPDQEALQAGIADLKAIVEAVKAFIKETGGSDEAITEQFVHQYLRLMSINFIRQREPMLFWLGQLLGFIEDGFTTETIPKPIGEGIVAFFKDPFQELGDVYGSLQTEEDARRISHGVFIPATFLLGHFTKLSNYARVPKPAALTYGWVPSDNSATPQGDELLTRTLSFSFKGSSDLKPIDLLPPENDPCNPADTPDPNQALESEATLTFMFVPRDHFGRAGLFVSFAGSAQVQRKLGDNWKLVVGPKSGGAANFFFGEGGIEGDGPGDLVVGVSIEHLKKEEEQPEIIPLTEKTRLEFGHLSASAEGSVHGIKAVARATDCALVISTDTDPVTDRTIPADQFRVDFDLGLGLADGHFFIEGGSGLEVTLPGSKTLGAVKVESLTLRLTPGGGPAATDLSFAVLATLQLKLGPLFITAQRLGLHGEIDFWDDFHFGFHKPEILGILVQSKIVKGGGFLGYNSTTGEYFGGLELTINEIVSVKAIAVVGTKMPDGSRGFSFAAVITVSDFPGINLGLGFRLTGVGGIIGIDRTFDFGRLEEKLKQGALRNILFPPNPVANAAAILADITQVFPPARDHYVFGLMFRIVWGSEKLVVIDLAAVIAESVSILGIVDVYFPRFDFVLVEVHVHVIGTLDVGRKRIFVHAEILNTSRIFGCRLSGGAAMLLSWGDEPVFILSFGGFNKRYEPQLPVGFPALDRLTVQLIDTKNLTATLRAYLAVTSNSIQIGGSLSIRAGISKFTIEGALTVDALLQFHGQPRFLFDLDAWIELKAFGVTLFEVHVRGSLSGGSPWHARGSASFKIWIFSCSVDFDETWGDAADEDSLPETDVKSLMIEAFKDVRNWTAELPPEAQGLVTLRQPVTGAMLHPLSALAITQRVAPLNLTLTKFGNAKPQGQSFFTIESISVGSSITGLTIEPVREHFARSQFFDMSDDEKFESPAFEKMDAGVRIGSAPLRHGAPITASMEYLILKYNAEKKELEPAGSKVVTDAEVKQLIGTSAAAHAPSAARRRQPPPAVKILPIKYVVANVKDQVPATEERSTTYSKATELMRERVAAQPQEKTQLQVLEVTQ